MSKISLNVEHKLIEVQQHSHGADSITFIFDRYTDNLIDLSLLKSKIVLDTYNVIISGLNNYLIQEYTSTNVKLTWVFDKNITTDVGEYSFQIIFVDNNDDIKLYTEVGKLKVKDSLDIETVMFEKNISLFQQWEDNMENLADSLKSARTHGSLLIGTDLNTLNMDKYCGIYALDKTYINMPNGITFGVLRVAVVGTYVLQELFSNSKYFTRMYVNSTWSTWTEH